MCNGLSFHRLGHWLSHRLSFDLLYHRLRNWLDCFHRLGDSWLGYWLSFCRLSHRLSHLLGFCRL